MRRENNTKPHLQQAFACILPLWSSTLLVKTEPASRTPTKAQNEQNQFPDLVSEIVCTSSLPTGGINATAKSSALPPPPSAPVHVSLAHAPTSLGNERRQWDLPSTSIRPHLPSVPTSLGRVPQPRNPRATHPFTHPPISRT